MSERDSCQFDSEDDPDEAQTQRDHHDYHRLMKELDSHQFAEEVISDFRSASAAAGIENESPVVPIIVPTIRHFAEMDSI